MNAGHHRFILGDVLDHVEGADCIELLFVGQAARIQLHEFHIGEPTTRPQKTCDMLLGADQIEATQGLQSRSARIPCRSRSPALAVAPVAAGTCRTWTR